MKQLAGFYLTSGLFIMFFAWGVAVSAMSDQKIDVVIKTNTPNTCLYCHVDVHATWEQALVTPQLLEAPFKSQSETNTLDTDSTVPAQVCLTCHTMMNASDLPIEKIQAQIDTTKSRVNHLNNDLGRIYHQYPHWDIDAYRIDKSEEQIRAERIRTLIAVIEADGSWGFHDPDYTEEILTEAEGLMADLLIRTDL